MLEIDQQRETSDPSCCVFAGELPSFQNLRQGVPGSGIWSSTFRFFPVSEEVQRGALQGKRSSSSTKSQNSAFFLSFCGIYSRDIAGYLQVKNMSKTWQTSWWIGQVMFIPSKNMVKICCNKFQQPYLVPDESWWVIILFLAEITDVEPAQLNVNPSAVR